MALLNPTFLLGVVVLLYLSSFVFFAVIRILTGVSIQRIGYLSLRRLAYTPRDGCRVELRGLGLSIHRPTFAQPTWISLVLSELVVTLDMRELGGQQPAATPSGRHEMPAGNSSPAEPDNLRRGRRAKSGSRGDVWEKLAMLRERVRQLHRNIQWLRMIDVVATNSTVNIVGIGSIQVGSVTVAVDTRRKAVDHARLFKFRATRKPPRQAEWILSLRSVLFTAEGHDSFDVLDHCLLNIQGVLNESSSSPGLEDAILSLKLGRVRVPYDDLHLCMTRYQQLRNTTQPASSDDAPGAVLAPVDEKEEGAEEAVVVDDDSSMEKVTDSRDFVGSILRGIKEVQFVVSYIGMTKKVMSVRPDGFPMLLNASMKEIGVGLHRLDPKSPAHRMHFSPKDIAHEGLAAALSISVGIDDGHGSPERLLYIPMATTTVRSTLPSKTIQLAHDGSIGEKNANIMFANLVITSPSIDLDPAHLPLLIAMMQPRVKPPPKAGPSAARGGGGGGGGGGGNHDVVSRLLPKANIKLSMHEPVLRMKLKPLKDTQDPDDYDLIISSISSVSLDAESSHSSVEDMHYFLDGALRLQSHNLYYQTCSGDRFNLITTDSFDLRAHLAAKPNVSVELTGNLQSCSVSMVRPEITDGLRQIVRQLRIDVEPEKRARSRTARNTNFLRSMPAWLARSQIEATDFNVEVAGVDEDISDDTRGVSLHLDSFGAEYRAHRLDGLQRQPGRRRTLSRSITQQQQQQQQSDSEMTPSPASPPQRLRKKAAAAAAAAAAGAQSTGDGRRLALHAKGFEAQIVEAADQLEPEPFLALPRLELVFSAASDNHGPVFQVQALVKTVMFHYSLYRHYSVGVAALTLRRAFMRTGRDVVIARHRHRGILDKRKDHDEDHHHHQQPGADAPRELITVDVKASLVQIKTEMPHDPVLMLRVYGLEFGRHRWSTPFLGFKSSWLYVETPRMRNVWSRMIGVKHGRIDLRETKHKSKSSTDSGGGGGGYVTEKMVDVASEAVRIAVPHEVIVARIMDNLVNVLKSVQQLHHRFKTGTNEYILEKKPEAPKIVPKISVRSRHFLFELEDGAFEWKLGIIYRTGREEQMQRIARQEAFRVKSKKVRDEEARRGGGGGGKLRARSTFPRGRNGQQHDHGSQWFRSRSADAYKADDSGHRIHGGAMPRYDPEREHLGIHGHAKVSEHKARAALDRFDAQAWKRRIDRAFRMSRRGMRDLRQSSFWGASSSAPDDVEENENILRVPERPALMSAFVADLSVVIDKPTFAMRDLPDFIHKVGKGMPRDMRYGLLVPTHVAIQMGEARLSLRDYPLPLLHIPPLRTGQSSRVPSVSLRANFVLAEEFRGPESTRAVRVNVVPPRSSDPASSNRGSFAIEVRRTIGPVKSFSDVSMDINTALPTRITWGPSYQPAIQDMMMVIESFTKPQVDPSERVGFWDKLRLNAHARVHVAWKGDGDMHLALKGTRDPYQITGSGAGFLMCWRNDVRWNINANDDPKQFMAVDSGEYILAIPDYSQQIRAAARRRGQENQHHHGSTGPTNSAATAAAATMTTTTGAITSTSTTFTDDVFRDGAVFKKVVMKLSGRVQWLAGLLFERPIEDGRRSFSFRPHYDVVLKNPAFAKPSREEQELGLPYDAMRGFRSRHIHLSIAVRAPVDRDWMSENPEPSRSYNTVHLTPRFFTHFFQWWGLFGQPMSLPIRQGQLFPGRERNSKKFGRHLATVKYSLLLAPLFLSHIYKHKDAEDYAENAVSATGLKVRFDSFMLDLHQRREEFNTLAKGRNMQSRTSGIKIHACQLDLANADVRAVSASLKGTTTEAIQKGSLAALVTDQDEKPDLSRFTIPDEDFSWIDMDDFVELDWILPTEPHPDTQILPLAFAPRLTYFRQTDIGGVIAGDPDRTSPFGDEPTHSCTMTHDDDPKRVQSRLIQERIDQLTVQMEAHTRNLGESELKVIQTNAEDPELVDNFEAFQKHTGVLKDKDLFLKMMLDQMQARPRPAPAAAAAANGHAPVSAAPSPSPDDSTTAGTSTSTSTSTCEGDGVDVPPTSDFESEFKNRFVIHNLQLKWNDVLRNIVLRYFHQTSQRRGFIYYLSRPAVKFILDIVEEQNKAKAKKTASASTTANANASANASANAPTGSKVNGASSSSSSSAAAPPRSNPSPSPSVRDKDSTADLEDRIKGLFGNSNGGGGGGGNRFAGADGGLDVNGDVSCGSIEELHSGISKEFSPQNSYHVRLIAPQIQLQSEKNKKHVVMVTAKGMELKVVEVMDKERISDTVSGLVQRRFLVNMDSIQFFVAHRKWFTTSLVSMYAGSRYGMPNGSPWPPWVPMEVMFDFHADPFGFKRVVQKTSAMLRYDKYNNLRLKYNDEVNGDDGGGGEKTEPSTNATTTSSPTTESRSDNLWVEFPQARALCNSSQYYAMYVIVLDLLLYSEPLEKTRSERLEKIILASDFSDLSGTPRMVQKLQERIRQLEEIKGHFQIYSQYLDKKGWQDRLALERDLAACEDELFFMMKAITTSQRKFSTNSDTSALLKWSIYAREIVWHLIQDSSEPLVELQLKDVEYDRTDNSDGSHMNLIRVGKVLGLNLLPDANYPAVIAPYDESDKKPAPAPATTATSLNSATTITTTTSAMPNVQRDMIRVYWHMLEAIAGIPVMDRFEVSLVPMKVQLEREAGKRLFEYIFPGMDRDKGGKDGSSAPGGGSKAGAAGEEEDGAGSSADSSDVSDEDDDATAAAEFAGNRGADNHLNTPVPDRDSSGFSTSAGSLELRLQPTLNSNVGHARSGNPKKALSVNSGGGHGFRLFRSGNPSKASVAKKASYDSLRNAGPFPRPGVIVRSSTGFSSKESKESAESKKTSRWRGGKSSHGGEQIQQQQQQQQQQQHHRRRRGNEEEQPQQQQKSDDLTKMINRASNYTTFAYIRIPSVVLCLSYKGKDHRNVEDLHDFVFRLPTLEWQNKTWSNLDLALALKKAVVKALISHTGAIIGNKLSKHRPNAEQRSKLREMASSSVLITPSAASHARAGESSIINIDSDDSSSFYGNSPADLSRTPPRPATASSTACNSNSSSIIMMSAPVRPASRSSSIASRQSHRTGGSSSMHNGSSAGGRIAPPFLAMTTPPSPVKGGRANETAGLGIDLPPPSPRPSSSGEGGGLAGLNHRRLLRNIGGGDSRRPGPGTGSAAEPERRKPGGGGLRDKLSIFTGRKRESTGSQDDRDEHDADVTGDEESRARIRASWAPGRTKTG